MRAARTVLVVGILATALACNFDEPSAGKLAAQFKQQRPAFDQLRLMAESDVKALGLREVSLNAEKSSLCGEDRLGTQCLGVGRWNTYADVMRRIGILAVSHQSAPERTYFVLYSYTYLMNGRFRGIVHTTATLAQVASAAEREDWKNIEGGWYTYLLVQ